MRNLAAVLVLFLAAAAPGPAPAATFIVPHFIEHAGRVGTVANTWDTTLHFTYFPGTGGTATGPGAEVQVYVFQGNGAMLTGAAQVVCQPCFVTLGTATRKVDMAIEDRFQGTFGVQTQRQGWMLIAIGGPDPDGVKAQVLQHRSNAAPNDLSLTPLDMQSVGFLSRIFLDGFERLARWASAETAVS